MANILIVDDSRTSRKILRNLLEAHGHTVIDEAVNGQEGVQKFQSLKPDLVTMDITMPVIDGVEAMKMIMALNREAKVIMITAAGQKNKMIECIKEGASEFVTKPFEEKKVIDTVEAVLAQ
ncbi:MAG: response regulator [Lachnospiraceae bacterium]|nr:response regulator [Lachnospiraceae bacterium]